MGILKKIGVDWKEMRLLSNLYMKQRIKVRIGGEISEGREIGRGYGKDSSVAFTLQHLLGRFNEELFPEHGGCIHRRKKNKCVRFADDMALLAEDERMLKNMLMELNERCEDYGMNINIRKTKAMVIGRKTKEDRYTN